MRLTNEEEKKLNMFPKYNRANTMHLVQYQNVYWMRQKELQNFKVFFSKNISWESKNILGTIYEHDSSTTLFHCIWIWGGLKIMLYFRWRRVLQERQEKILHGKNEKIAWQGGRGSEISHCNVTSFTNDLFIFQHFLLCNDREFINIYFVRSRSQCIRKAE